jgi:hypothetical protein
VQGETSAASIFEVCTVTLGGGAALANRLAPCADAVKVAGAPDIFAVGRVSVVVTVDCWILLILPVRWGDAISGALAYNPTVAASPH